MIGSRPNQRPSRTIAAELWGLQSAFVRAKLTDVHVALPPTIKHRRVFRPALNVYEDHGVTIPLLTEAIDTLLGQRPIDLHGHRSTDRPRLGITRGSHLSTRCPIARHWCVWSDSYRTNYWCKLLSHVTLSHEIVYPNSYHYTWEYVSWETCILHLIRRQYCAVCLSFRVFDCLSRPDASYIRAKL